MEKAIIVFQSDWTYAEGAIAATYGVIKTVDKTLEIIDATHEIPQYDAYSASYRLYQYMRFWPKGTVFVSVVDPGVGTNRKACVAKTKNGYYVVTPDNGTLTHIDMYYGIEEIRVIDETINRLRNYDTDEVSIFHGRDLFGYCAARLASGIITYNEVGPKYDLNEIVRFNISKAKINEDSIEGMIEINDPNFGNLWSNITKKEFEDFGFKHGDKINCKIYYDDELRYEDDIYYYSSFGKANNHDVMIYNNELNKIGLAEVIGNLTKSHNLGFGDKYKIVFKKVK